MATDTNVHSYQDVYASVRAKLDYANQTIVKTRQLNDLSGDIIDSLVKLDRRYSLASNQLNTSFTQISGKGKESESGDLLNGPREEAERLIQDATALYRVGVQDSELVSGAREVIKVDE